MSTRAIVTLRNDAAVGTVAGVAVAEQRRRIRMMPETTSGVVAEREATESARRAGRSGSGHRQSTNDRDASTGAKSTRVNRRVRIRHPPGNRLTPPSAFAHCSPSGGASPIGKTSQILEKFTSVQPDCGIGRSLSGLKSDRHQNPFSEGTQSGRSQNAPLRPNAMHCRFGVLRQGRRPITPPFSSDGEQLAGWPLNLRTRR